MMWNNEMMRCWPLNSIKKDVIAIVKWLHSIISNLYLHDRLSIFLYLLYIDRFWFGQLGKSEIYTAIEKSFQMSDMCCVK